MRSLSLRVRLMIFTIAYVVITAVSAYLIVHRYMAFVRDPEAFMTASPGDEAFGDWSLLLLIAGMYLVPTAVLGWMMRGDEKAYDGYARTLFALSLTSPLSAVLLQLYGGGRE